MKFVKIYIILMIIITCLPLYGAYLALTGHFPYFTSGAFPDAAYTVSLQNSIVSAIICAVISTVFGTILAFQLDNIKESLSGLFTKDAGYEIYIFNILFFAVMWGIVYLGGRTVGFVTIGYCLICIPLVMCIVKSALKGFDLIKTSSYEIGSYPLQTFINLTLPTVISPIIGSFLASFTIAFNDIIIAQLVSHGTADTFALKLIEYTKAGADVGFAYIIMLIASAVLAVAAAALCVKNNK